MCEQRVAYLPLSQTDSIRVSGQPINVKPIYSLSWYLQRKYLPLYLQLKDAETLCRGHSQLSFGEHSAANQVRLHLSIRSNILLKLTVWRAGGNNIANSVTYSWLGLPLINMFKWWTLKDTGTWLHTVGSVVQQPPEPPKRIQTGRYFLKMGLTSPMWCSAGNFSW